MAAIIAGGKFRVLERHQWQGMNFANQAQKIADLTEKYCVELKLGYLHEVATKDDFFNIKNASRDDLLSAHRVPPQMMGIIPNNTGGFGT